jgi:hypothetical protein
MGPTLKDKDIRQPLHDWLLSLHPHDLDTSVIYELKLPRPSARVDVAVVNGELAAFEIKSDADTLSRLPRQIASFSKVFDRICVVTTVRHQANVERYIPSWWGIAVADTRCGHIDLTFLRKPQLNPAPDQSALLYALHVPELIALLKDCSGKASPRSLNKTGLVELAIRLPAHDVRRAARNALRRRHSA